MKPGITHPRALTMFVVTDHPADFPDGYVCRPISIVPGVPGAAHGEIACVAETLAELRLPFAGMLHRIAHQPGEDGAIVETWL